ASLQLQPARGQPPRPVGRGAAGAVHRAGQRRRPHLADD
ncbi:hypothetical protein BN1708_018560, partial [Verticillium longisporum]